MDKSLLVLLGTAATIGFVHTVLGPDHYLPFVVLSKARGWTSRKTALVTALCGVGHVLSSVVLGLIGIVIGTALFRLEAIEAVRGDIAAWLLMAFGFAYFVWGVHRAVRSRSHEHSHVHEGGAEHSHFHGHTGEHSHVHDARSRSATPWILFLIFVFGPCEPLIPILMFPAARGSISHVVLVAAVFGLATVGTMLTVVMTSYYGLSRVRVKSMERYGHAFAGFALFASGGAIAFLGL
ncbi:MAG: sulfite exporter TauE/SafE family protein [Candidatus Eisenbacteria bacterium]